MKLAWVVSYYPLTKISQVEKSIVIDKLNMLPTIAINKEIQLLTNFSCYMRLYVTWLFSETNSMEFYGLFIFIYY